MAQRIYEISFAIAGKMAGNFGGTFAFASSRISGLKTDLQKLNAEYKKGNIPVAEYSAKQQQLTRQILETQRAQQLLNKTMERSNQWGNSLTRAAAGSVRNVLSIGAGAAAIGGGIVLASSIQKAIEYESQLSSIQALTGISNEELKKMDDLALKMGADTKYSALEAAQGIEELLKAGLSPATVQAGGLEAALNLATAGGLELTEAAEIMSDALNGFKKDGMSASDAANILAGAANASSTDVHKLKESISAVGPVADMIGVSFRGVNATLAAFSNNSLKGSDAGTSLKTMLMNMQPQTKQARELFAKFGLSALDGSNNILFANGRLKDMSEVAGILHDKFKHLNEQQRADAFFNLFGSDAVRAASILFKEGADGIKEMYKQIADVTALDVAKKKMDNAAGSIEQFRGAIETLQIRALRPTLPLIKKVFQEAGDIVEKYTPAITSAVQSGVDSAKAYFKTHFVDNPEFQKLDRQGKFEFIIQDLKKTFDAWYQAGGNAQIASATSSLIRFISDALKGSSDQLTSVGAQLGKSMASGMLTGLEQFAKDNPKLAALLTFIATPGSLPVKAAAAVTVGTAGEVNQLVDNVDKNRTKSGEDWAKSVKNLEDTNNATPYLGETTLSGGGNRSWFQNTKDSVRGYFIDKGWMEPPQPHAIGGIFNQPHVGLLAEAGPEAYIPINGSARSESIWRTTGEKLGLNPERGGDTYNLHFAPVINGGSAPDIQSALQQEGQSLLDKLQQLQHQQRRVSFNGG